MFKIAAVFSDNMVLQRNKNVAVFGEADENGTVTAEICGNKASAAAADGKWKVILPPMQAGGPYTLTLCFNGTQIRTFTNVMIGEVWLCGGQSNMEFELRNAKDGREELATLTPDLPVRYYYTNKVATLEAAIEAEKNTGWSLAGPESSEAWSAVGYWFAKKLSRELGVTVGLIGCNWGGTSATNWIDLPHIEGCAELASYLEEFKKHTEGVSLEQQKREYEEYTEYEREWNAKAGEIWKDEPGLSWAQMQERIGPNNWPGPRNLFNPFSPARLYETLLMRVCPYTPAGFLYYQGESDDHRPDAYYTLLTLLIRLWREWWGDDKLPFIMVQLPGFKFANDPDFKHWCLIREAQMRTFETVKNTGIAVAIDCGEFNNIHPLDKQPVGERLCLQAEELVYGMDVEGFGPLYRSYCVSGRELKLCFDHADGGFEVKGESVTGFELAGEDKQFFPAKAELGKGTVTLTADEVPEPRYARYAWGNFPEYSLFGTNGIPLAPFRTSTDDQ